MADEKPLKLKKDIKKKKNLECIICFTPASKEKINHISQGIFNSIRKAARIRQLSGKTDSERCNSLCNAIPDAIVQYKHGYHRKCYQRFTTTRRITKRQRDEIEEHSETKSPRKKENLVLYLQLQCFYPKISVLYAQRE